MFTSKQRPIVIPQWEHQKLAGTLALLWGNTDFERPPVSFESFLSLALESIAKILGIIKVLFPHSSPHRRALLS